MATKKRATKQKTAITGDVGAIKNLLVRGAGRKRSLKDRQIMTELSVAGPSGTKRVAVLQRASDPGTETRHDRDPRDPIVIHCDQD